MSILRVVFWDQLSLSISSLRDIQPRGDTFILITCFFKIKDFIKNLEIPILEMPIIFISIFII